MNKFKNENDKKILNLQEKIKIKKSKLEKLNRFSPITNCTILIDGERYNINALELESCTFLLVKINSLLISAKDLNLSNVKISGYSLEDWSADLSSRLAILNRKKEESHLKVMEEKLKKLLSDDTKIELELQEIEKDLID